MELPGSDSMPYHEHCNRIMWDIVKERGVRDGQPVEASSLFMVRSKDRVTSLIRDPCLSAAQFEVRRAWLSWPAYRGWSVSVTHPIAAASLCELDRVSAASCWSRRLMTRVS
jgi:hypothetical protein